MGLSRLVIASVVIAAVVASMGASMGCSPLYGGKPEELRNPPKKRPPVEEEAGVPLQKWDEECNAEFFAKSSALPRPSEAKPIAESANTTLVGADRAPDASTRARMVIDAIGRFKAALAKDPFNAEATYGLAVAYTKARKKGCAIALLKRLSALSVNARFSEDATRMMDAASANPIFKPFKKDAEAALGR